MPPIFERSNEGKPSSVLSLKQKSQNGLWPAKTDLIHKILNAATTHVSSHGTEAPISVNRKPYIF